VSIVDKYLHIQQNMVSDFGSNIPGNLYYMTKLLKALMKSNPFPQSKQFSEHFNLNCQSIIYMTKQIKIGKKELKELQIDLPGSSSRL